MDPSGELLAPLAFDLVGLIDVSDRFASEAAAQLHHGLNTLHRLALEQEAREGLGEALAIAYYKAIVLLPNRPALMQAVADLLLRYRFLCALEGVDDRRAHTFWWRHGLDRELLESRSLHALAHLEASLQAEERCFGRHLADYFAVEPGCVAQRPPAALGFTGLELVLGHLWRFRRDHPPEPAGAERQLYLLAPPSHVAVVDADQLCGLVAQLLPLLLSWCPDPEAVICAPLGTRKVSLSKQGLHSSSTYFDGGKPVPFSLNRSLDPYLVLTPSPLVHGTELRSAPLWFGPLLDSLSSLVFRDPLDYQLGEPAFRHQVLECRSPGSLLDVERGTAALLPTSRERCLVEGLLLRSGRARFALTPCHQFADRYARAQGLSGHGPSGVMNQSLLATAAGVLSTWRYERNFDSWSGRSADVARHPSLNFLAWEPLDSQAGSAARSLRIGPLTYSGYPSECKIEDLRLFALGEQVYAIAALILSRSRYRSWLPEISAEAAANNTIDDMLVLQSVGRLDPWRGDLSFLHLPVLHGLRDPEGAAVQRPRGFEKNWLLCPWRQGLALLYSIQPWQVFTSENGLQHWQPLHDAPLELPAGIQGPLRNSAHPFPLDGLEQQGRWGLVVHRRRQQSYIYDQYLLVLSAVTLEPLRISRVPVLSVNVEAVGLDRGFRKNPGVCYVSSVLVCDNNVQFYFNLFDCRTCVLSLPLADLRAMVDDDAQFCALSL